MHGQHGGELIRSWQELPLADEPPPASPELLQGIPPALLQSLSPNSPCGILLPQIVLHRLAAFFAQDLSCEQMALLVGRVFRIPAGWLLFVDDVLPVASTHATRIHVAMSPRSWQGLWSLLDADAAPAFLGWAHSHPGHGAYFSVEDRRTQSLWFTRPWHIGIVLDPVTNEVAGFSGPTSVPVTFSIG
jgi:hypothetical protein